MIERLSPLFWICLVLAAITVAVYWPARQYDYVNFDDDVYVYDNPHVQQGLAWKEIKWAFCDRHVAFWLPLTWISFMIDSQFFGHTAAAYHTTNIVLHALNAVLLLCLLCRTTGALWRSGLVAALFALHPLRVESVVWITERKDVLSTFFALISLCCYVRYAEKRSEEDGNRGVGRLPYVVALFFFALALMAKPVFVTLPFALLLLDYWPLKRMMTERSQTARGNADEQRRFGRHFSSVLVEKLPFLLLSVVCSLITMRSAETSIAAHVPFALRLENALVSYVKYLGNTFWPVGLNIYYPYPRFIPPWQSAAALLVLSGITVLAVRNRNRRPWLCVGWFWFLGMLVPNIGLVQSGQQAMADRFAYVPLIGVFVALVWTASEWLRTPSLKIIGTTAAFGVLCCCVLLTNHLLPFWKNSITVCERSLAVTNQNYFVHHNLAVAFINAGKLEHAERHFLETIRIEPTFVPAHNNFGILLLKKGQTNTALQHFHTALKLKPRNFTAHYRIGVVLSEQGQVDEAANHFQQAVEIQPQDAELRFEFGSLLLRQKKTMAAIEQWREATRLRPDWAEAANNLAWLLATSADPAICNGREAVELAECACRLMQPTPSAFLATLAAAYAEAGRFDEAVKANRTAIDSLKSSSNVDLAAKLEKRIALYAARKPYRDQ